jgi:hypothetical protein
MARPEKLKDELKALITNIKIEHPKRTMKEIQADVRLYLIERMKKDNPELPEREIVRIINSKNLPGESAINKYLTRINKGIAKPDPEDNSWNTAILHDEPITPDVVPVLVGVQSQRQAYLSVGLSVREARWLNRLFGFRDIFRRKCPSDGNDYEKEVVFIPNMLATWSQIYAYREKIDVLAGIEKPDFSELDTYILNNDCTLGYKYVSAFYFRSSEVASLGTEKEKYKRFDKTYTSSTLIAQIWLMECGLLGHSLGTPDLTYNSLKVYYTGLSVLTCGDIQRLHRFQKMSYGKKVELLVTLRHLSKDRSLPKDYKLYKLAEDMDGILRNLFKNEVNK